MNLMMMMVITFPLLTAGATPEGDGAADLPGGGGGLDESRLTVDRHCYECKVKYRDPTAKDLVMFLHAWAYSVSSY